MKLLSSLLCALAVASAAYAEPAQGEPTKRELEIVAVEKPAKQPEDAEHASYLALASAPAFLPRSYLYWGSPVGPSWDRQALVFGLEYALHLPVYNDLRKKALLGKSWSGAATVSFEGALRMFDAPSLPVRLPSYRPTITGQLFYLWHRAQPVLFEVRTGFFHYSNGQDGCIFDAKARDGTEACNDAIASVQNPARQLNRTDASFSTNGYVLAAHARIHRVNVNGLAIAHLALGLSASGNIRVGPGKLEAPLRELYGWGEVRAEVEAHRLFDWGAMTLRSSFSAFPDTDPRVPKFSGVLEAIVGGRWFTGFGLFVRYYGGRDFLNALFVDSIQQLAIGIAWNADRPLVFKATRIP